jgi:hypothetical protein
LSDATRAIDEASIGSYKLVDTAQGGSNVVTERHAFQNDLGSGHQEHVLEIGQRFEGCMEREPGEQDMHERKFTSSLDISAAQYSQ